MRSVVRKNSLFPLCRRRQPALGGFLRRNPSPGGRESTPRIPGQHAPHPADRIPGRGADDPFQFRRTLFIGKGNRDGLSHLPGPDPAVQLFPYHPGQDLLDPRPVQRPDDRPGPVRPAAQGIHGSRHKRFLRRQGIRHVCLHRPGTVPLRQGRKSPPPGFRHGETDCGKERPAPAV